MKLLIPAAAAWLAGVALAAAGAETNPAAAAPSSGPVVRGAPARLLCLAGHQHTQLMMILHQPNHAPDERARLLEVEDTGDTLQLKNR